MSSKNHSLLYTLLFIFSLLLSHLPQNINRCMNLDKITYRSALISTRKTCNLVQIHATLAPCLCGEFFQVLPTDSAEDPSFYLLCAFLISLIKTTILALNLTIGQNSLAIKFFLCFFSSELGSSGGAGVRSTHCTLYGIV